MLNLLDKLEATACGAVFPRDGSILVEGGAQAWAYAASAPLDGDGPAVIRALVKLSSGSMSIGVLSKAHDRFLSERSIPVTGDFVLLELPVAEPGNSGALIFRTHEDGRTKPQLEVKQLVLEPQIGIVQRSLEVDPIVENLWPLETAVFNIPAMRCWSRERLQATLTGDLWRDNLILNKWEFATGVSRLESFPWRFSVPFVLCNARCEFCSAWLVKGEPMPIDLLDRLDAVLPYLAYIDMVGWGEPLIHPQFGDILSKLCDRADRRARIALTTNGVHLKKWADHLTAANVRDFAISIHAARPETHEDLMGLPQGSFTNILEGIRSVTSKKNGSMGITVGLVFIVTRQNIGEISEFIALAHDLKVDSIFIRTLKFQERAVPGLDYHRLPPYLHPEFEALRARAIDAISQSTIPVQATPETWATKVFPEHDEPAILAQPLVAREVRRASKELRRQGPRDSESLPLGEPSTPESRDPYDDRYRLEPEIANDLLENPYARTAPLFCPSPYTALYINGLDRLVTPCCYMTRVPSHQYIFLRKGASFEDVWNSPAMITLRKSLSGGPLMQPCLKCAFYW
jgi:pyruvate-formate lyase-activating enzyme